MSDCGQTECWQLEIECPQTHYTLLEHCLSSLGAMAVSLSDAKHNPLYCVIPDEHPLWPTIKIISLFDQPLSATTKDKIHQWEKNHIITQWHYAPMVTLDWQAQCQQQHPALCCGTRLWICPSWTTPPDPGAVNIALDPGIAFGTGTHPTTQLCLQWLDQHITNQATLIDYGCGSGILAIAAIKLGVHHAYAIDHDPQALDATRRNARRNQCEQSLTVRADSHTIGQHIADVVVANILLNPLILLKYHLYHLTKPGGYCVVSGILQTQIMTLYTHYQSEFTMVDQIQRDEWACCVFSRHA